MTYPSFDHWCNITGYEQYSKYRHDCKQSETIPIDEHEWLTDTYYDNLAEQAEYEREACIDEQYRKSN